MWEAWQVQQSCQEVARSSSLLPWCHCSDSGMCWQRAGGQMLLCLALVLTTCKLWLQTSPCSSLISGQLSWRNCQKRDKNRVTGKRHGEKFLCFPVSSRFVAVWTHKPPNANFPNLLNPFRRGAKKKRWLLSMVNGYHGLGVLLCPRGYKPI